jgi:hypothetical protein
MDYVAVFNPELLFGGIPDFFLAFYVFVDWQRASESFDDGFIIMESDTNIY